MTFAIRLRREPAVDHSATAARPAPVDVRAIRRHFAFPQTGRIVTNNAASTQPPRELLALQASLVPGYENVHRGQSLPCRRRRRAGAAPARVYAGGVAAAG
jgi:hypothetical protein